MTEVLMTLPFKRRFKDLSKRYRKIQADIQPIVEAFTPKPTVASRRSNVRQQTLSIYQKVQHHPRSNHAKLTIDRLIRPSLDKLHCSNIPDYIRTYERLQKLPVEVVYPGHYQTFGREKYQQILGEYLERRRQLSSTIKTDSELWH